VHWLQNIFLFGLTPTLVVSAVWGIFKILKYSAPLKAAVLETLTNPERAPAELLRKQYWIVREVALGSKAFNKRRVIFSIGILGLWIIFLGLCLYLVPDTFLGFVASIYFHFAAAHPLPYLALVVFTIAILLLVMELFDALLTSAIFRTNNLAFNAVLLMLAYAVSAWESSMQSRF
jgi:hypothetical protein